MVITLYKLDASPPARAVLMTMEVLGIHDVEMVDIDVFGKEHLKEEYLKMNPQHTIPTLKDDDFVIWDSHAITTYLVNKYAENHSLYPTDPKKRAIIDQRLHFDSGIIFPAIRAAAAPIFLGGEKAFRPELLANVESGYEFLEKFLTSSTWLVGEEITMADICCVATVSSMNIAAPIDENLYPKLTAWLQRCASQDFYKKCNQPGVDLIAAIIRSKTEQ